MVLKERKLNSKFRAQFLLLVIILTSCDVELESAGCQNLQRIAADEALMSDLWAKLVDILNAPEQLEESGAKVGLLYVSKVPGNFGLDWNELGIPLRHATLEVSGTGLKYDNFDPHLVSGIRLGYGYREHLTLSVSGQPANGDTNRIRMSWTLDDVIVKCQ